MNLRVLNTQCPSPKSNIYIYISKKEGQQITHESIGKGKKETDRYSLLVLNTVSKLNYG
jgi:hypothetical protein